MKLTSDSPGNVKKIQNGYYRDSSGGLLLNTAAIITGTSKTSQQDLEISRRLTNRTSSKTYEAQVLIYKATEFVYF